VTPRRALVLVVGLVGVVLLAFPLRSIVYQWVILPLAQLIWWLGVFYRAIPQIVLWVILLVFLGVFSLRFFVVHWPELHPSRRISEFRMGEVQQVSFWLTRGRRGIFSRWHVANLLANLALDILSGRAGTGRIAARLSGPMWNPPEEVQRFLEAGLTTTYADYPRTRRFSSEHPTPLDSDPAQAVDYLESLLEGEHDDQRH
jgi:hypothetical protein